MTTRTLESIDKAAQDLGELYSKKLFQEEIYFKCLLGLAYEYMALHEGEKALKLIFKCSPSYFPGEMLNQTEEDPLFRDVVIVLTHSLAKAGYLDTTPSDDMVKPIAEA